MSREDRIRWDNRYQNADTEFAFKGFPLPAFSSHTDQFPTCGVAVDIACGDGRVAVWLAQRGLQVHAVDVSPRAIEIARERAAHLGVSNRCLFDVFDLDDGLPKSPPADVLVCHNYRNPDLYPAMKRRLAPGGLLAIVTLSEVDHGPGRFRSARGELETSFSELEILCKGEQNGRAWLLARGG